MAQQQTERRRFLGRALAMAVTAGAGASASASAAAAGGGQASASQTAEPRDQPTAPQAKGNAPIIDTHQHLWDLGRFRLPWLQKGAPLDRNYLPDDYLKAAEGLGIVKSVYMEVDVDPTQHVAEAEYVIDLCRRRVGPLSAAVIGGRPSSADFLPYLARFKNEPVVKGIRQVLHGETTPPGYCLDPQFIRGIRQLGEHGLSFDICMRSGELGDAARLVDACPDTSFILDHCGNPSVRAKDLTAWRADVARLAERKNLVCKVSGIVASTAPGPWTPDDLAPIVNHVLTSFGSDRVVFGGDWPVCTLGAPLRQWVEALRLIVRDRSAGEQEKLFSSNARRVYRLG